MKIDPDKVSVKDVMQADTVVLDASAPVERAIEMFEDYGISGAPVTDGSGRLCGVLTTSDVLHLTSVDEAAPGAPSPESDRTDEPDESGGEESSSDPDSSPDLGHGRVGDWMTREILSVGPDATLGEVCDLMNRETVHRVFVTDGNLLLGVVSSSDVVRFVAKSSSAWDGSEGP